MHKGIGSHQSAAMLKDEWLTPPYILKALGNFDLDPCSPVIRPWNSAKNHYTIEDNGLSKEWSGRVWCNPPYGLHTQKWLERLADHGTGTALIFARTETKMFFSEVWNKASSVLFLEGRLYFHHVDGTKARGNAGAPSVLVAYGAVDSDILKTCGLKGKFIQLS